MSTHFATINRIFFSHAFFNKSVPGFGHYRRSTRRINYINSIPADVRTPDEEAIRQQRADFMREKVALLKGRYRRLIELRYFDEFSYEEIADTLAIPLGTVKAQLFRARELLLNILQHTEIAKEHGKN